MSKSTFGQCNPDPNYRISLTKTDQHCPNANDGTITATLTSGTPQYKYRLLELPFRNRIDSSAWINDTTFTFTNVAVGHYRVSVWDSCNRIQSRDIRVFSSTISPNLSAAYFQSRSLGYSCDSINIERITYYRPQDFPVWLTLRNVADTNEVYLQNYRIDSTSQYLDSTIPRLTPHLGGSNQYEIILSDTCGRRNRYIGGMGVPQASLSYTNDPNNTCQKEVYLSTYISSSYFSGQFFKPNFRFEIFVETDTNSGMYRKIIDSLNSAYPSYYMRFAWDSIFVRDSVRDVVLAKNVRVVYTDSCLNTFQRTLSITPRVKSFVMNQDNGSCNDSTVNLSIYLTYGDPPYTIVLDSGPAYYSSSVHNVDSVPMSYPDTIATSSSQLYNLPLGHYKIKYWDECGFYVDTSITLENRRFKYSAAPVQGCLGSHQIHFTEDFDSFNNSAVYGSGVNIWKVRTGRPDSIIQKDANFSGYASQLDDYYSDLEPGMYRYSIVPGYFWAPSNYNYTILPCYPIIDTILLEPYQQPEIDSATIYECSPGDSANVLFSTSKGLGPFNYDFFTDSGLYFGPFLSDSLVFLNSMFNNNGYDSMILRVEDQCGNARVASSVVYIDSCDSVAFILPFQKVFLKGEKSFNSSFNLRWKCLSSSKPVSFEILVLNNKEKQWQLIDKQENFYQLSILSWHTYRVKSELSSTTSFRIKAEFADGSNVWSNTVSVNESPDAENSLVIVPSPNQGAFRVICETRMVGPREVEIYNSQGVLMSSETIVFKKQGEGFKAEVSKNLLPNGLYILKLGEQIVRFSVLKP